MSRKSWKHKLSARRGSEAACLLTCVFFFVFASLSPCWCPSYIFPAIPRRFCYNGALEACRRAEPPQWQLACSLLSQMRAEGVPPNEVCYKTAILTCQAASELGEAEALLNEMVEAGFVPQEELKASGVAAACASP